MLSLNVLFFSIALKQNICSNSVKTLKDNEGARWLHFEVVSFLFGFLAEHSEALPGLSIRKSHM